MRLSTKQGRIVDNNGWCMHGPEACKEKLIELENDEKE